MFCGLTGANPSIASADQCQSAAAPGTDAPGLTEVHATGLAGADATGDANRLAVVKPAEVGMDPERLSRIQPIIQEAIDKKQIPGAVVLVVRQGKICFREAIGFRSLEPTSTPMTADTVFDLASLTKPVATATALMILVEQGKLRLHDRVAEPLPEFGQNGKDKITVEQLLLHTSGLMGDNPEGDYRDGLKKALEHIYQLSLQSEPGSKFRYSDVGYIMLGQLMEKLSGETLDGFTRRHIFEPLAMLAGGSGGPCRPVLHCRRPGDLRSNAAEPGGIQGQAHSQSRHGPTDGQSESGQRWLASAGMGRADFVFIQSR